MFKSSQRDFIRLDRRKFLAAASGLIAAGVLPQSVLAQAAMANMKVGNFDVTVLSDGKFDLPLKVLAPDAKPEDLRVLLGLAADAETTPSFFQPTLVQFGSEKVLFDTGNGAGREGAGLLVEALKAANVDTASITKVVYTHAHPDHLWGTLDKDNKPVFANASYHISEAEMNFWMAPDLESKMPEDRRPMVKNTQGKMTAIKDKLATFKPSTELLPGIMPMDTGGHTPGHSSFELAGGDGAIIVGDAIANPAVFFAHPEWKFGFDADGERASKSRKMLLDLASAGKKQLIGYHWPNNGLGRAEAKDGAFVYVAG